MLDRNNLHAYQNRAVSFIKDRKRCGLFLDMGLGKTASALTAVSDLIDDFQIRKTLVIAPLRVANSVWKQEVSKWSHLDHMRVSVCTGSAKQRLQGLMTSTDVYVINRENVDWLVKHYGSKWPFDMVIIDESSSFKNPSTKRFRSLRRILPMTEYMVLLTGTPSPNSLLDLWPQMFLIDFGDALGSTVISYKQRFFESDYMGYKWNIKEGAADTIHNLILPRVLYMSADDYLDMPPRIDLTEMVELPSEALAIYKDFEKTLLAKLEDGEEVEAATAAVLANKLLQFANGAIYTDDKKNWSETHKAKLDALEEIVEDNSNETLLVAYNYKSDLARLQARFPDAVVLDKRQTTIDRWNAGEIKMLLAHPASAGHGLNLQNGGNLIVWFGLTWSLEYYQQFNARLHRQGQEKPVRILHLTGKGTIDERVMGVLAHKDMTQRGLLAALKPSSK
jgi:SNF2 family DNA or RNA helicase